MREVTLIESKKSRMHKFRDYDGFYSTSVILASCVDRDACNFYMICVSSLIELVMYIAWHCSKLYSTG